MPSRAVSHRKERVNHHAFASAAAFKQTQRSQCARSTSVTVAAKKKSTVGAASEVSSNEDADEGFDIILGTGLPEYIATGLLGIFTGFFASGVSLLLTNN